jgi:hypothetical protein
MKKEHLEWINKWNSDNNPYGKCKEATLEMQKVFPELKLVRGHYYCTIWGERMHFWLVDENNEIVDPTARQFPTKGFCVYVPWNEGDPEPTGICPNCGEYCYDSKTCCSEACDRAYAAYIMSST